MTIEYCTTPEFEKDFKALLKRFRSLEGDLETLKSALIETYYKEIPIPQNAIATISGFCTDDYTVCKIRKISCRALKGKGSASGLRIIYLYEKQVCRVTFLELYYKGDKENEDRNRIQNYINNFLHSD